MIDYDNGIGIIGLTARLDASRGCELGFVSHAHSDHAKRHKKIIATPETALLYGSRYRNVPARVLPYNRPAKIDDVTVELLPSGHMLGAAQIMVRADGQRIIYTGDFKVYPNLTCTPLETRRCDVLIMESTYGDPQYVFPPQAEVYARVVMFIQRCRDERQLPVLVGYAMGKAQEAVKLAQSQGFEVAVDSAVGRICELYRSAGVPLGSTPNWRTVNLQEQVLVVTPQTLRKEEYQRLPRKRSVFLSGWAQGQGTRRFSAADYSLPLSDHADFSQLLGYVERCQPRKIFTLHGSPRFAQLLRDRGWDAEFLGKGETALVVSRARPAGRKPVPQGQNYELF
ncbi:MAG: MBL fold metallo-hydrolase RNA specificity domain-containing protein [bacterium]